MKKICLMITGQMRTYQKCFNNILENLILSNKDYEFHIHLLTEYSGKNGGTPKNKFLNKETSLQEFKENIEKTYGNYLKLLIIEEENNLIKFPDFLNNYGPWLCLYRNYYLLSKINNKKEYDFFVRLRPDIIFTKPIKLNLLDKYSKTIYIISGNNTRNNSWFHNRDWDHCCIANYDGYKLWCEYFKFINYNIEQHFNTFTNEVRFNNKGYWQKSKTNDKSIIATQLFVKEIKNSGFELIFDALNIFTIVIR